MLVPTGDDGDLVVLDPELARRVLSELGLAEGEHGSRLGDLRVLHLNSDWPVEIFLVSDLLISSILFWPTFIPVDFSRDDDNYLTENRGFI